MSDPGQKTAKRRRSPHPAGRFVSADLKAYLDGELSPVRRWLVRIHLAHCAVCREEVAWLQRLGKNMRNLEGARPRPELRARILSTLPPMDSVAASPSVVPGRSLRPALRLALCCGLLTLLLGGVYAMTRYAARHGNPKSEAPTALVTQPPKMMARTSPAPPARRPSVAPPPVQQTISAKDNDPFAPLPARNIDVPDPVSMEADRLVKQEEKRLQEAAARKLPQKWSQTIAAVQNLKNRDGVYIPVELTVTDMNAAQKQLAHWAHQTNTPLVALPNTDSSVKVTLYVTPKTGSTLLTAMKQTGTVYLLTTPEGNGWTGPAKAPVAVSADPRSSATLNPSPYTPQPKSSPDTQASKSGTSAKTDGRIAITVVLVAAPTFSH